MSVDTDEYQGTVFDVSGNKMYGPDGSYKRRLFKHSQYPQLLTVLGPYSIRGQGCIKSTCSVIAQA